MSGVMFLHIAHAIGEGTINLQGDCINRTERPVAFRWALGTEVFLALLILAAAAITLS